MRAWRRIRVCLAEELRRICGDALVVGALRMSAPVFVPDRVAPVFALLRLDDLLDVFVELRHVGLEEGRLALR